MNYQEYEKASKDFCKKGCFVGIVNFAWLFVIPLVIMWLWNAIIVPKFGAPTFRYLEVFGVTYIYKLFTGKVVLFDFGHDFFKKEREAFNQFRAEGERLKEEK